MKSTTFMLQVKVPTDVNEGDVYIIDGDSYKITKIKALKFIDMRTMQVIGLGKPFNS